MPRWSALLLGLCLGTPVRAADLAGNYAIWGEGGRSCNHYLTSASEGAARARYEAFLMGYLTAYNALAPETYSALGSYSLEEALDWLDGYCDLHKVDSFERAVTQLVSARHEQRQQRPPGVSGGAWGRVAAPAPRP
jgi:hypothetical protein